MSTIPRERAGGTTGYTVQIQRKRNKKVVLNLTQTFDRLPAAKAWEKKKEELSKPGGLDLAIAGASKPQGAILADAIEQTLTGRKRSVGKTTKGNLRIVKECAIARMACENIESHHIRELAEELAAVGRAPQTDGNKAEKLLGGGFAGSPEEHRPLRAATVGQLDALLRSDGRCRSPHDPSRRQQGRLRPAPTTPRVDRLSEKLRKRERIKPAGGLWTASSPGAPFAVRPPSQRGISVAAKRANLEHLPVFPDHAPAILESRRRWAGGSRLRDLRLWR